MIKEEEGLKRKRDLVTTTLFENFLPVRLSWAAWQSLLLANSMNTLPQPAKPLITKLKGKFPLKRL